MVSKCAVNFTNIFSNFQVCVRLNNYPKVIKKHLPEKGDNIFKCVSDFRIIFETIKI